jgi:hypothetical protein
LGHQGFTPCDEGQPQTRRTRHHPRPLGSEINDQLNTFTLRFCYAFRRLCEQDIATVETLPTYRSEQRQADRAGVAVRIHPQSLRTLSRTDR